ncbi:MAG: DUF58 domain-containing protein, partial [Bacteroidota bacterium]
MAFSEVREYFPGDDVRTIDWNVTAKLNHPYVKVFEEERELTVMLLVDISRSQEFGTSVQFKNEMIAELCAVLSFSAIGNNDKIGLLLFSDKIEKFIAPKKGRSHALRIIRELLEFRPVSSGTDIGNALRYFTNMMKKRTIAFVVSDFIADDFSEPLKIASKKHDTIFIRVNDPREKELPPIGLAKVRDPETGGIIWVDTSNKKSREHYRHWWENKDAHIRALAVKSKVDIIDLSTDGSYITPLRKFFRKREIRK